MNALGIDYSINCPGICLRTDDSVKWFVNYRGTGKDYPALENVEFIRSTTKDNTNRFIELTNWALDIVEKYKPTIVGFEDYAFSANGNITDLAENAGYFKISMRKMFPEIPLVLFPPTKIKKMATGKGNANKDAMSEAFFKDFPQYKHWPKLCHPKSDKALSPIADIADAWYIATEAMFHYAAYILPDILDANSKAQASS